MKDVNLDVFDKVYLIREIENKILRLIEEKRGPSNNTKIDIQVEIWKRLLDIVKNQENTKKKHKYVFDVDSIGEVNDGSHSFDELYWHRMILFSVICNKYKDKAWKSWKHCSKENFPMYEDYFIVGIDTPEGQFTYHYHKDCWDMFDIIELNEAPEFDGHTSDDIIRLFSLINNKEGDE